MLMSLSMNQSYKTRAVGEKWKLRFQKAHKFLFIKILKLCCWRERKVTLAEQALQYFFTQ